MSITVENNLKNAANSELLEQRVHYLPCKIEDDGPADVANYFEPYVVQHTNQDLTASLRGHPLEGRNMELPAGYRAVVLTESHQTLDADVHRKLKVCGGFTRLTCWNWDKPVSHNDHVTRALQWTHLAEAIHGD